MRAPTTSCTVQIFCLEKFIFINLRRRSNIENNTLLPILYFYDSSVLMLSEDLPYPQKILVSLQRVYTCSKLPLVLITKSNVKINKAKKKKKPFIILVSCLSSQISFEKMKWKLKLPSFLFLFTLTGTNLYCCTIWSHYCPQTPAQDSHRL